MVIITGYNSFERQIVITVVCFLPCYLVYGKPDGHHSIPTIIQVWRRLLSGEQRGLRAGIADMAALSAVAPRQYWAYDSTLLGSRLVDGSQVRSLRKFSDFSQKIQELYVCSPTFAQRLIVGAKEARGRDWH